MKNKIIFSDAEIKEAKDRLERGDYSKEEHLHLRFIATGHKNEYSPKEPFYSNRSFFHLKNISCLLTVNSKTEEGVFTHEDYASYYEFVKKDGSVIYFSGGEEFLGKLVYENYEPFKLILSAECPSNKTIIIANGSLTSSEL